MKEVKNRDLEELPIQRLLSGSGNDARYKIPMYQRNYAWEEGEITQLLQDIIDSMPKESTQAKPYYIGTLVVHDCGKNVYETIDGQQRLTTLSLLACYLKNTKVIADGNGCCEKLRIEFESREHSTKTMQVLFDGTNKALLNGYRLISEKLPKLITEDGNYDIEEFSQYLLNQVRIMRVTVPQDTDLNHYFEIMNNRGEQLEKHEILKAKLLKTFIEIEDIAERERCEACLNTIWEATANMEKYVQMGFSKDLRGKVFGSEWGELRYDSFDALCQLDGFDSRINDRGNPGSVAKDATKRSLTDLIENPVLRVDESSSGGEERPDRFTSVVNFSNFLLHVLSVYHGTGGGDVPLDDKRLIVTFENHLLGKGSEEVKKFAYSLLKAKFLYDHYIVKREFIKGSDGWSLKRLKKSNDDSPNYVNAFSSDGADEGGEADNKSILMLITAFHVSTPTMVYKHWLNATLNYLFHQERIIASEYLKHLESVAKAFMFDRYLSLGDGLDYHTMIYENNGRCQSSLEDFNAENIKGKLSFGNIENNFVFNYLDYLLWQDKKDDKDSKIKDFEFTARSSVEHYFPQNPIVKEEKLDDAEALNSFGNLCLISHSKNSTLSNNMPGAKKEYYDGLGVKIDSVKQHLMMEDAENWGVSTIRKHYEEMVGVLLGRYTDS